MSIPPETADVVTNSIPPEGDEYNARRQEELHAAILNKAQLSRRYAEMIRTGAPVDQIGAVIDAIAQIDREIPHISKDLAVSVQGRNLTIFLDRMDASLAKMDATAALAGVAARLDQQINIVQQILTAHKETVRGLRKLTKDVTILKQAAADSQEDRADLRQRIDAMSTSQAVFTASMLLSAHAVIVIDPGQIIVSVNQKVLKYFGYSDNELIGHPLDILIPERFRAAHRRHIEAFAQSSDTQRLMADRHEVYGLHKDRSEFLIRAAIVKISDGFIAVIERVGDGNR
jgi:PAS domain S-box-containing protein